MSEQPQEGHHDDCEDCRRERKENEVYIAVYERMQALRKHADKISLGVTSHANGMKAVRELSQSLDAGMIKATKVQGEADSRSIQTVGFEIASAMAQKISRNRLKAENEVLRKRLQSIYERRRLQETQLREEYPCTLPKIAQATKQRFKESRPVYECENNHPIQPGKGVTNGWATLQNDSDSCSTKFSFFKNTRINASSYRHKYQNMNLWLYEQENLNQPLVNKEPIALRTRTRRLP